MRIKGTLQILIGAILAGLFGLSSIAQMMHIQDVPPSAGHIATMVLCGTIAAVGILLLIAGYRNLHRKVHYLCTKEECGRATQYPTDGWYFTDPDAYRWRRVVNPKGIYGKEVNCKACGHERTFWPNTSNALASACLTTVDPELLRHP